MDEELTLTKRAVARRDEENRDDGLAAAVAAHQGARTLLLASRRDARAADNAALVRRHGGRPLSKIVRPRATMREVSHLLAGTRAARKCRTITHNDKNVRVIR